MSVPEENQDLREELSLLPYETRLMMESVADAHGTPVFSMKQHNLWTLDDSIVYVFSELSSLKDKVKLTRKNLTVQVAPTHCEFQTITT